MSIKKEDIISVLENILYFPERDNLVALKMVDNVQIADQIISLNLVFPDLTQKASEITTEQVKKALGEKFSDYTISVNPVAQKDVDQGPLSGVKHVIAVASGKGGVGKSTVAVNLAISLAKKGYKTAFVDADIYGPSAPIMFGLMEERPLATEQNGKTMIVPIEKFGLKILSIGFFMDQKQALIWRGPMASSAMSQLFNDTVWGDIDYMVVDLPPGTGDIHLTLAQSFPVSGAIIITTPQQVALADVVRASTMFRQEKINVPILGLVENMAYFTPEELPDNKYYIFGKGHARKFADELEIPFLGDIPMVQGIAESGDNGEPVALDDESVEGKAFATIADTVVKQMNK